MRGLIFILTSVGFGLLAFFVFAVSVFGDCFNEACHRSTRNLLLGEGGVLLAAFTIFCIWRLRSGVQAWLVAPALALMAILVWRLFFAFAA
jgi:purine-cytosine permease-like protein